MCFSPNKSYARALPQELDLLHQLWCDFDELNFHNKVSGIHIIIYEAIFNLGFRSIEILFSSYELVLEMCFFIKARQGYATRI